MAGGESCGRLTCVGRERRRARESRGRRQAGSGAARARTLPRTPEDSFSPTPTGSWPRARTDDSAWRHPMPSPRRSCRTPRRNHKREPLTGLGQRNGRPRPCHEYVTRRKKTGTKKLFKTKTKREGGRRLLCVLVRYSVTTPRGARSGRQGVQTNLPFIEVITQGNMEHGGKKTIPDVGDTRLKNTRK